MCYILYFEICDWLGLTKNELCASLSVSTLNAQTYSEWKFNGEPNTSVNKFNSLLSCQNLPFGNYTFDVRLEETMVINIPSSTAVG